MCNRVLANGSLSSQQSGEGEIRQRLIEKDVIDCIVALPGQLFSTTQIPVCLWFIARDKSNGIVKDKKLRDRRGDVLFIDARNMGTMKTRTLKELTDQDVATIADTYHAWREKNGKYEDVPGFAKSVKIEDIAAKRFVLTPGMYVEQAVRGDDNEPFPDKMARLTATLKTQMERGKVLDTKIRRQLQKVGYGWCQRRCNIRPRGGVKSGHAAVTGAM
ncbi:N-6 DNA methylase, partial [Paracoccus pantotrophus]|uniref:N-6 DNA methylase n=1 Tax=Paracoccus pantotrophus TaxID=82367 RepID=UPI0023E39443